MPDSCEESSRSPRRNSSPTTRRILSGFVVEHYQVVLLDAAQQGRERMHEELRALCSAEVPGDTQRNLEIVPTYSAETFKHILVPLWLLTYTYGKRVFQVVANGYTGTIAGRYPKSPWKIAAAVLLAIIAIVTIIVLAQK